MELNQLNYFRTVARLENITKAAEELYISQPNLSTAISRLESSLGVKLFHRARGRIYLTDIGRQMLVHVEAAFQELDAAVTEIHEGENDRLDSINAAASISGLLPELFLHSYQDYGLVPTSQMLIPDGEIEKRVAEGELDLGILSAQPKDERLHWELVGRSPLVAVMRSTNPLCSSWDGTLSGFAGAHFICNTIYCARELLNEVCAQAGFEPRVVRTSNEQEFFDERSFDMGDNVTLCPLHILPFLAQTPRFDLSFCLLREPFAVAELGLVRRREGCRTEIVADFYDYALEQIESMIEERNAQGRLILERSSDLSRLPG